MKLDGMTHLAALILIVLMVWSKFDTTFEGIAFREFLNLVEVNSEAKFVKIYGYLDGDWFGYSANLPFKENADILTCFDGIRCYQYYIYAVCA